MNGTNLHLREHVPYRKDPIPVHIFPSCAEGRAFFIKVLEGATDKALQVQPCEEDGPRDEASVRLCFGSGFVLIEALVPDVSIQSYDSADLQYGGDGRITLDRSTRQERRFFQLRPRDSLFIHDRTFTLLSSNAVAAEKESQGQVSDSAQESQPEGDESREGKDPGDHREGNPVEQDQTEQDPLDQEDLERYRPFESIPSVENQCDMDSKDTNTSQTGQPKHKYLRKKAMSQGSEQQSLTSHSHPKASPSPKALQDITNRRSRPAGLGKNGAQSQNLTSRTRSKRQRVEQDSGNSDEAMADPVNADTEQANPPSNSQPAGRDLLEPSDETKSKRSKTEHPPSLSQSQRGADAAVETTEETSAPLPTSSHQAEMEPNSPKIARSSPQCSESKGARRAKIYKADTSDQETQDSLMDQIVVRRVNIKASSMPTKEKTEGSQDDQNTKRGRNPSEPPSSARSRKATPRKPLDTSTAAIGERSTKGAEDPLEPPSSGRSTRSTTAATDHGHKRKAKDHSEPSSSARSTRSTPRKPLTTIIDYDDSLSTSNNDNDDGDKNPIKILFTTSSTNIESNKSLMKFLSLHSITPVSHIEECTHLCLGSSIDLKKTAKTITAVLLGKYIVTSDWIIKSAQAKRLLNPADFLAVNPDREVEWGLEAPLTEIIARNRRSGGCLLLKGWDVVFTPAAKREAGVAAFGDLKEIVKFAGGRCLGTKVPTQEPRSGKGKEGKKEEADENDDDDAGGREEEGEEESKLIIATDNDPALADLKAAGWGKCFKRDIISMSALRGVLDTRSDEFRVSMSTSMVKENKTGQGKEKGKRNKKKSPTKD